MQNELLNNVLDLAVKNAQLFTATHSSDFLYPPSYNSKKYVHDLATNAYFEALAIVRHYVKLTSDAYWTGVGAFNVDLFMMTPSISSPMGPGSDSEAISIPFGKYLTNLTDSSQFGFEPLMFHIDKAYCYLPSMRGEHPDERHLNQFFHCEAEIVGTLDTLLPLVEGYVQALSRTLLALTPLVQLMSADFTKTHSHLTHIIESKGFVVKEFDEIYPWLQANSSFHTSDEYGRNITNEGEVALSREMGDGLPMWVCNYDRDIVAFYQKPHPANSEVVINADLIFPPIIEGAIGGEIVGAGQRQDNAHEMRESLRRQRIQPDPYAWYVQLRELPGYTTTSGFGLGVERFIAWALGYSDIKNVIHYPRLKNVQTLP